MSPTAFLVAWINEQEGLPEAFGQIPANRPARFITVQRTSGTEHRFTARCVFAIQAWAGTAAEAEALAWELSRRITWDMPHDARVAKTAIEAAYPFADTSGQPRWQLTAAITLINL